MSEIDWQAVFFSVQDALRVRARKRFGDTPDAESAFNFALDTLSRQGFDTAGEGYTGRGSPEGFIVIRVVNLMHDYATAKYGRPRPPSWLSRLGATWTQAFEMLCLRRQLPESIADALYTAAGVDAPTARTMLREIKARIPRCGQLSGGELAMSDASPSHDLADRTADIASAPTLETTEAQSLIGALNGVFDPTSSSTGGAQPTRTLAGALQRLGESFHLSDDDRIMLRLIYQQGFTVARAARALGAKDYDLRRRHTRLLRKLRTAFDDCGLGPVSDPQQGNAS